MLKATYWSSIALGITAVKWKPNFLNEVKLWDIWSNPLPGIYRLQLLIYLQSIVYHFISKLKTNGKRKIYKSITFVIMESYVHIKVNSKASTRCDGQSLCTFISHLVCSPWSYCHWASKKFHLYPDYISLSSDQMPFSRWHRVFQVGIV